MLIFACHLCGNTLALRMFGTAKRDFIGQDVSILVPTPFAFAHNSYFSSFMASGACVRRLHFFTYAHCLETHVCVCVCGCGQRVIQVMLNTTRFVLGKHRQGHIFPIIQATCLTDSGFAAVIQKIDVAFEYVIFSLESFDVFECTQDSQRVFGVSDSCCNCAGAPLC